MTPQRVRVSEMGKGQLLRVQVVREPEPTYLPVRYYRGSALVSVISVRDCRRPGGGLWPAGCPYRLTVREGSGNLLTAYWSGFQTHMVGLHRFVIDADCPKCNWPERWFDQQAKVFGCNHCDYTSREREA